MSFKNHISLFKKSFFDNKYIEVDDSKIELPMKKTKVNKLTIRKSEIPLDEQDEQNLYIEEVQAEPQTAEIQPEEIQPEEVVVQEEVDQNEMGYIPIANTTGAGQTEAGLIWPTFASISASGLIAAYLLGNKSSDPVAPTIIPTSLLADTSDTGTKGDSTTNSTTPQITGTAAANATIEVQLNGKSYTVQSDSNGYFSLTIPNSDKLNDGTYTPLLNANGQGYVHGNAFTVDSKAPTIDISSNKSMVNANESATITFVLSEESTNFTINDIVVSGGTISQFSGSGKNYTALFTHDNNQVNQGFITIESNAFSDKAGNQNVDGADANNTIRMERDTTPPNGNKAPTITIDTDVNNDAFINRDELNASSSITVSAAFDKSLVAVGDVVVFTDTSNATLVVNKVTLTQSMIDAGVASTIFSAPADGADFNVKAVIKDPFENATPEGSDFAKMDTSDLSGVGISINEDTDNNAIVNVIELNGSSTLSAKITLPNGAKAGDVLLVSGTGNASQEIKLTTAHIIAKELTVAFTAPSNGTQFEVSAQLSDIAKNSSNLASDSATVNTTPAGAPNVTIITDTNGDGYINRVELGASTSVSVRIDLPTSAVSGDRLTVTDGTNNKTIILTESDIIAKFINTEFTAPAHGQSILVRASITNQANNISQEGSDSARIDTSNFAQSNDASKTALIINIDTDNNGDSFISSSELAATNNKIKTTITLPTSAEVGDTLSIKATGNNDRNINLTDADIAAGKIIINDWNSSGDNTTFNVTASIKDLAKNASPSPDAQDSATIRSTTAAAPSVNISEDSSTDKIISASELVGNIDISITLPSAAKAGDVLNVDINGSTQNIVLTSQNITDHAVTISTDPLSNGTKLTVTAHIKDVAGNTSPNGSDSVTIDTARPTISITSDKSALKAGETATITFTLSEDSTDFAVGDIEFTGGTLSNFSGSGKVYTATFTRSSDATLTSSTTIKVADDKFTDAAGNLNKDGSEGNNLVTMTSLNVPKAAADTASATEASGTNNGTAGINPTGNVLTNDTDPDVADILKVKDIQAGSGAVTAVAGTGTTSVVGQYGTLVIAADGSYTYTVDNANATVQALNSSSTALTDVFTYTVKDPSGLTHSATVTVSIAGANDAPIVTPDAATYTYVENASALIANAALTLSDVDNDNLTGATVTISAGKTTGDLLAFTAANGITGSYDSATGKLTLTGTATKAQYQDALRSVTFSSSSDTPTAKTDTADNRTVSWQVDDGQASSHASNLGTSTINVTAVNDAPTGSVIIEGTKAKGYTLTANVSTIGDLDGLGIYSYQWFADGVQISGATSSAYLLTTSEVGKAITVQVRYIDGGSTIETLSSNATVPVVTSPDGTINSASAEGALLNSPSLVITDDQAMTVANGATTVFTLTFSGPVAGLTESDIVTTGTVVAGSLTGTGTATVINGVSYYSTYTVQVNAPASGVSSFSLQVADGSYSDATNNNLFGKGASAVQSYGDGNARDGNMLWYTSGWNSCAGGSAFNSTNNSNLTSGTWGNLTNPSESFQNNYDYDGSLYNGVEKIVFSNKAQLNLVQGQKYAFDVDFYAIKQTANAANAKWLLVDSNGTKLVDLTAWYTTQSAGSVSGATMLTNNTWTWVGSTYTSTVTGIYYLALAWDVVGGGPSSDEMAFDRINFSTIAGGKSLPGTAAAETLTGTSSSDSITVNGADTVVAGAGNDTITVTGTTFASIDGGEGSADTLVLSGTYGTLDLTKPTVAATVKGVEIIDLGVSGSSSANTLIIGVSKVLELASGSAGTTKQLIINGDSSDHLQLSAQYSNGASTGTWTAGSTTTVNSVTYTIYTYSGESNLQLLVQQGVTVDTTAYSIASGDVVAAANTMVTIGDVETAASGGSTGSGDGGSQQAANVNNHTTDTSPLIQGTLTQALVGTQSVKIFRINMTDASTTEVALGSVTVSGTSWSYQDSGLVAGKQYRYIARVMDGSTVLDDSNTYTMNVVSGYTTSSPLVLDLNGDGVHTASVGTGTQFDLTGFGKQSVGWTAGGDGFLVRDLNHDGQINSGAEMFGNNTTLANGAKALNGWAAISALDNNADGVIDFNDSAFAELKVWVDANRDGLTDAGELRTLSDVGVASINVAHLENCIVENGNVLDGAGSFTKVDGSTGSMTDVWFQLAGTPQLDLSKSLVKAGVVDLTNGQAQTLKLDLNAVLETGVSTQLVVNGDSSDTVVLTDLNEHWMRQAQTVTQNGHTYDVYTANDSDLTQLLVEQNMYQTFKL